MLTQPEKFMREFIALYKIHPVLWDKNHVHYRNRNERNEAYEVLLRKCQEYYPDADEDFVRNKIDSMRATFRKEYRKVQESKAKANNPSEVYKPNLWYYTLLLYTVGEECHDVEYEPINQEPDTNLIRIPFWSREYSAFLIDYLKKYPCLYNISDPSYNNKRKRYESFKKITEKLKSTTGKIFVVEDVRRKIQLLKGQFRYECKKIEESQVHGSSENEAYTPSLWCFEMLSFLKAHNKKYKEVNGGRKNNDVKKESDSDMSDSQLHDDFPLHDDLDESNDVKSVANSEDDNGDDIYDTIAKNVAHKLRDMTEEQRQIADKIVHDVMYHGQMENLSAQSRLSLNGL